MIKRGQLTKNFHIDEFRCNDAAKTPVPESMILNVLELAQNLQVIRDHIGESISINSGYRTDDYNDSVGGSDESQHKEAKAGDLRAAKMSPEDLHHAIEKLMLGGRIKNGGLGSYISFTHYDVRDHQARW